jgi:alpha-amylase
MRNLSLVTLVICIGYFLVDATKDPATVNGRSVYVHLFEWKWNDIAAECERFLGPKGFGGVQISPPNEHAHINTPYRPWWQRYQPVSYKLQSRSGTEQEFRSMVQRCNAAGVRIYVDAVINHMAAGGNSASAGSSFNPGQKSFPAVPYGVNDFNDRRCYTASGNIENYNDVNQVRNCKLVGLPDLATGDEYVRQKIADYMNNLIDIGVAGFRIDASKHMWPGDCQIIFNKLKNLRSDVFGANKRPFIFQEVIDLGGEPIKNTDYTSLGRVTEFKYGMFLSQVINRSNNQKLAFLKNFGTGWGFIADSDAVSFVDNHDNQRGHGGGGAILTFFESRKYKMGNAFMLAWPYGFAQIMSSYNFNRNDDAQGPPTNGGGDTKDVLINSDGTCGNGWICEHRWRQITNMVEFRNVAGTAPVANWWDNGNHQIAFSRGNRAFLAINNENFAMDVTLQTGLPAGTYCDVNSGNKVNGQCSGRSVVVGGDGRARINIPYYEEDPVIAIHVDSRL